MLTTEHIRAARAALNLSLEDLARAAGLSLHDLEAIEHGRQAANAAALQKLSSVFAAKGIVFFDAGQDDPGIGPGLRWRSAISDEGIRPENLSSANDG